MNEAKNTKDNQMKATIKAVTKTGHLEMVIESDGQTITDFKVLDFNNLGGYKVEKAGTIGIKYLFEYCELKLKGKIKFSCNGDEILKSKLIKKANKLGLKFV